MQFWRRLFTKKWLLAFCVLALVSCRTVSFYAQAAIGQWEISSRARPIDSVLSDRRTDAKVRTRLATVQDLRSFASEHLHLPAADQYACYCDLGRKYAVWVVYAAPEFSVKPKTWWYPMLGSLAYRGFFSEADAAREADALTKAGYDVFTGGVEAYSTLGWFKDPILSTFLRRRDEDLAELLFHELTHQRLYIPGDTEFNEAFATAVGHEGARRWLKAKGKTRELQEFEADMIVERAFIKLVLQTRERLSSLYEKAGASPDEMRRQKTAEFDRLKREAEALKQRFGGGISVDRWFAKPVNNARLNTLSTYFDLLPGFEAMLAEEGNDLERFFARVDQMKTMTRSERRHLLDQSTQNRSRPSS